MRKVMFNKWVDSLWQEKASPENIVPSASNPAKNAKYLEWKLYKAGYFEEGFQSAGYFHTWSQQTEMLDNNQVEHYTVAIVENSEGLIIHVPTKHLKFIEGPEQNEIKYWDGKPPGMGNIILTNNVDEAKEYGLSALKEKVATKYAEE